MSSRVHGLGPRADGRPAAAGEGAEGHTVSARDANETTSFLQDIEAAAAAAQRDGTGEEATADGGAAGRGRRRCDLWWLLALPAAVMLLLAAREWQNGFSGTTAVLARVASMQLRRQPADGWQSSTGQPKPAPVHQQSPGGSTQQAAHSSPQADGAAQFPAGAATGLAAGGPSIAQGAAAPQPEPDDSAATSRQQQKQAQQPHISPQTAQQQQTDDRQQGQQQPAAPGPAEPPQVDTGAPQVSAPAGDRIGPGPSLADEPAGAGGKAAADAAPAVAPAVAAASGEVKTAAAARGDPSSAPAASPGDSSASAAVPAEPPRSTSAPGAASSSAARRPAESADGAWDAAAPQQGAAAPASGGGRRRHGGPAVVVLPSQFCQVVKPEVEQRCLAAWLPECQAAVRGPYAASYLSPYARIAPHMAALGFDRYIVNAVSKRHKPGDGSAWDSTLQAADIVILEAQMVKGVLEAYPNKTYVVVQGKAAAAMMTCDSTVWCAQHLLEKPQVARFLQHTALQPLELNNAQRYKKLPHYHLMQQVHLDGIPEAEAGWGPAPGQAAFSAAQLAKAATLNPMFWRWRYPVTCHGKPDFARLMAPALEAGSDGSPPDFLPPLSDRPIDVAFSGSVAPPAFRNTESQRVQNQLYAAHRQALLDELAAIQKRNPQLHVKTATQIAYPDFVKLLRSTKVFISPLGHGEYSGKDYEAVISRALLVKPLARHLQSYPDIYDVNVTCVEVAMDFSNLEVVLQGLLANAPRMQRIADAAYGRLIEYSDPKRVAADVGSMLHAVAAEAGL